MVSPILTNPHPLVLWDQPLGPESKAAVTKARPVHRQQGGLLEKQVALTLSIFIISSVFLDFTQHLQPRSQAKGSRMSMNTHLSLHVFVNWECHGVMEYLKNWGPPKILQKLIFYVLVSVEPMVFKTLKPWRHTHIFANHLPYLHTFDLFTKVISELVAWLTHSIRKHTSLRANAINFRVQIKT